MAVSWIQRTVTLEELTDTRIERESLELWEGEVVEKMSPAGKRHNRIANIILRLFMEFCDSHPQLDNAASDDGFLLSRRPDTLLCPDASLFRRRDEAAGPWHHFAPDLAVEVRSPEDSLTGMRAKRDLYFRHGAEQVWIVDPERRTLQVNFADGRTLEADGGTVPCEGIACGLVVDLDAVFAR